MSKLQKRIVMGSLTGVMALAAMAAPYLSAAAQSDPFGLQAKIDTLSSTTGNYFSIMITSFWPLLLGALILATIVGVVIGLIMLFFRHKGAR